MDQAPPIIRPARDVDEAALEEFYRVAFPKRPLPTVWRWLYRTSLPDNPLPLVMLDAGRVVGHAGGIPFTARVEGRAVRAQWFVDFALLPGYRRHGFGTTLTEQWVKSGDLCVTFCNDESLRIFRRLGWMTSPEPTLHTLWLKPGAHPRLRGVPGPARAIAGSAASVVMGVARSGATPLEPQPLDRPARDALGRAMADRDPNGEGTVGARRDADYVVWRIEQSPALLKYRVYQDRDMLMLISLGDGERLDVLWMSPASADARAIRAALAALSRWGAANGYSAVRYFPADPALAASLRALLPAVSRPRFAYWTADRALLARLAQVHWRWQLIDSDFEWI